MAECHPVAFRWPLVAKARGAKIIHVDPRFTRTSAMADIYAPIRAGSDVAFLGGLINYVVNHDRWNRDPFFREFLVNYTNAATIINNGYKDAEDLDGVFSGLIAYDEKIQAWPYNAFLAQYDNTTWQYAGSEAEQRGWTASTQKTGEQAVGDRDVPRDRAAGEAAAKGREQKPAPEPPFEPLVKSLLKPPPRQDPTLRHPSTVFQIVKRHFARYTPETVERVTGCPKETFLQVAETILANSGRDRTTSFAYAVRGPSIRTAPR
jgi:formate dehydrogenase major subunit